MESEFEVNIDTDQTPSEFIRSLTSSIDLKLNKLSGDPSDLYSACIYKVSLMLLKVNEAAYAPRLVSIGPLHHGLSQLRGMEAHKLRLLNKFLCRFGVALSTLVSFAAQEERYARGCYGGTVNISMEKLSEMILLDGVFIVELFLENHFFQLRDRNEIIFVNPWMYNDLLNDILLVENQLPLRILKGILSFVDISFFNGGIELTIYDLAQKFFKDVGNTWRTPLTKCCYRARHFVEFLLILHAHIQPRKLPTSARKKFEYTRSIRELRHAGVKFRSGDGSCIFEVEFSEGVLTIPKLIVNDTTETFLRNLMAYELCGYRGNYSEDITSYIFLMHGLLYSPRDVEELVQDGIIMNELGENKLVVDLFDNLYKEVGSATDVFHFAKVCEDLNRYSRDRIHECRVWFFGLSMRMNQEYLPNGWVLTSVMGAVTLLILAIVQTGCALIQVDQGSKHD